MISGISGLPVPPDLPYSAEFNKACGPSFPPFVAFAVGWRETLSIMTPTQAAICVSGDGGHGVMQLTSSYPSDWADPFTNILYAVNDFLLPDLMQFRREGLAGDDLIKLIAAAYNAGPLTAWAAHLKGNVDSVTTNNYGAGVLAIYHSLLATGKPV